MFTIERVQPEDKGEVLSFIKDTWNWEWQELTATAIERAMKKASDLIDQDYKVMH